MNMAVSYKRLFKLLIDKDMKKKEFCEKTGVSYSTLRKMMHGENVQVDILENICLKLDCQLSDIAEILPNPEPSLENGTADSVQ
jgi:hypothetical protein